MQNKLFFQYFRLKVKYQWYEKTLYVVVQSCCAPRVWLYYVHWSISVQRLGNTLCHLYNLVSAVVLYSFCRMHMLIVYALKACLVKGGLINLVHTYVPMFQWCFMLLNPSICLANVSILGHIFTGLCKCDFEGNILKQFESTKVRKLSLNKRKLRDFQKLNCACCLEELTFTHCL